MFHGRQRSSLCDDVSRRCFIYTLKLDSTFHECEEFPLVLFIALFIIIILRHVSDLSDQPHISKNYTALGHLQMFGKREFKSIFFSRILILQLNHTFVLLLFG